MGTGLEEFQDLLRERRRRLHEDPLSFYKPLGHQSRFHVSQARERAIIGSNRSGKTHSGAAEVCRTATGTNPHRPNRQVPNAGWVISVSNEAQRINLQPKFEQWILPYLAKPPIPRGHGIWDRLELKNRSVIQFKSCEQHPKTFQGAAIDYAWFDEEPYEEHFKETKLRLVDLRGDLWITMTPLYGMDWTYDYFVDPQKRSKDSFILDPPPSMWDNAKSKGGYLDDDEILRIENSISDPLERRIRIYGEYHQQAGRVYKDWNHEIHGIEKMPREFMNDDGTMSTGLSYYCGIDTGRCFAASFMACDYLGNLYLFDEYFAEDRPVAEHARRILNMWTTHGVWPEFIVDQKSQHKLDLADANVTCLDSWADEMFRINAVMDYLAYNPVKSIGWKHSNPRLYVVRQKCPRFLWEVQRYQWESPAQSGSSEGEKKNAPRKKDDHMCFPKGVPVLTGRGVIPIEEVHAGDYVPTRKGWKRVLRSGRTHFGRPSPITRATFDDGTFLDGTPDHPVWTENAGWKPLHLLTHKDTLLTCEVKRSIGTGFLFGATQTQNVLPIASTSGLISTIGSKEFKLFIKKFGRPLMGLFRKVFTSTTRMKTLSTTDSRILSHFVPALISDCITSAVRLPAFFDTWLASVLWRLFGTPLSWVVAGIRPTESASGRGEGIAALFASFAASPIGASVRCSSVQGIVSARRGDFPALTTSPRSASCAAPLIEPTDTLEWKPVRARVVRVLAARPEPVYNLAVEGQHEFVASGILVSNCDALGYIVERRPEPARPPADEEDARPLHDRVREHAKEKLKQKRSGANDDPNGADPWGLDD